MLACAIGAGGRRVRGTGGGMKEVEMGADGAEPAAWPWWSCALALAWASAGASAAVFAAVVAVVEACEAVIALGIGTPMCRP